MIDQTNSTSSTEQAESESGVNAVPLRDSHGRLVGGGVSLNPNGRPKRKTTFTGIIRDLPDVTKQEIVEAIVKSAKDGSTKAFEALADRAEGKPKQSIEVSTETDDTTRLWLDELRALQEGQTVDGEVISSG